MELKIKNDKKNDLLSRREIEFYIISDGPTPSLNEVHIELCKNLNTDPLSTTITKIDQRFGIKQAIGYAHIYENIELMNRIEPKHILARKEKRAPKPTEDEKEVKETKPELDVKEKSETDKDKIEKSE